jgi:hypothetical protein
VKKNDGAKLGEKVNDGLDRVLSETHCYTYFDEDPLQGSINEGFLTERMKNTAFIPSSAVEKLELKD